MLTTFDRDDNVFQNIRAEAMGYLLKDTPAETLIDTIRRVHAGEAFIQPEIALRALREIASGPKYVPARRSSSNPGLIYLAVSTRCWCFWPRARVTATLARNRSLPKTQPRITCRIF